MPPAPAILKSFATWVSFLTPISLRSLIFSVSFPFLGLDFIAATFGFSDLSGLADSVAFVGFAAGTLAFFGLSSAFALAAGSVAVFVKSVDLLLVGMYSIELSLRVFISVAETRI